MSFTNTNTNTDNALYLLQQKYSYPTNPTTPYFQDETYKLFTEEEMNNIIEMGYKNKLQYQLNSEGKFVVDLFSQKTTYLLPSENTGYIYNRIRQFIVEINKNVWNFDLFDFYEPLKFNEYNASEKSSTAFHTDTGFDFTNFRKLTFIMQLSNETDYEGGEVILLNSSKPIIMPKTRGSIVIFPSYILHKVDPIKKGIRNSLVIFAHGPPLK